MKKSNRVLLVSALAMAVSVTAQAETFDIIVKHNAAVISSSNDIQAQKAHMTRTMNAVNIPFDTISHKITAKSNYSIISVSADSAESAKVLLQQTGQFLAIDIIPQVSVPMPRSPAVYPVTTASINAGVPTDSYYYTQQPYMSAFGDKVGVRGDVRAGHNFESVWSATPNTVKTIRVGVADGGFIHHEDINYVNESADFIDRDQDAFEPAELFDGSTDNNCSPHGNGVSSGIAALHNGVLGMVGGSTHVEIVAARVLRCGLGGLHFADAIRWFAGASYEDEGIADISTPVEVINLSLAGPADHCMDYVQESIQYAVDRGILIVAAAGNNNLDVNGYYPANCDNLITTGATNWSHDKADFSNFGALIDIAAQGVEVVGYGHPLSEAPGYTMLWDGTSNAAPQVVAAIANVKGQVDGISNNDIEYLLKVTSNNYSTDSQCVLDGNICGPGSLNAFNLIEAAKLYVTGDLSYIRHSLNEGATCDATMLIEHLEGTVPVCETYTVSFNEFAAEKDTFTYQLHRVASGGDLSLENSNVELFIDNETRPHFNMVLSEDELNDYDYGYTVCTDGVCSNTIQTMTVDSSKNSQCP